MCIPYQYYAVATPDAHASRYRLRLGHLTPRLDGVAHRVQLGELSVYRRV